MEEIKGAFLSENPRLDSLIRENPKTDSAFLTKQINPRPLGSWCVEGTEEVDSSHS